MGKQNIVLTEQEKNIDNVLNILETDDKGNIKCIGYNFQKIIEEDTYLNNKYQYDLFSYKREYIERDKSGKVKRIRRWEDTDSAKFRIYIEKNYGVMKRDKFDDGLEIAFHSKGYHPLKELIEYKEWDKVSRIDNFFKDILKCDGNIDYLRECSRMLFYGGISRVYEPGIKFDYMFVMTGRQGIGKSTIVQWLGLHNNFYREVTEIEGNKGVECILGGWICEFAELMAFRGNASSERLKAFITRQVDNTRLAFRENTSSYPRQCIFIGTTNEPDFLSDITGNRRFLPLHVSLEVGEIFDREEEIKDYIIECWREAYYLYKEKKTYLTIPRKYFDIVEEERDTVVIEDLKLMKLESYLDEKEIGYRICRKEIALNVFSKLEKDINRGHSNLISKYMSIQDNWVYKKCATVLPEYGSQKYWIKMEPSKRELRMKELKNEEENLDEE